MEVVHTSPDVRYWPEVLCCTIPTHMSDLEIKVTDSEKKFIIKFLVKVFRVHVSLPKEAYTNILKFYHPKLKIFR